MQRSALRVQKEEYEQDTRIDDEHWRRDIVELKQKQYVKLYKLTKH